MKYLGTALCLVVLALACLYLVTVGAMAVLTANPPVGAR